MDNNFMNLPIQLLDVLQEEEMILVLGGSVKPEPNNGIGTCGGTNNAGGICTGGPNNGSGTCTGGPNNKDGTCTGGPNNNNGNCTAN